MNVHVVYRPGHPPEGAFETKKLAEDYIRDRNNESDDCGHQIVTLEVVKVSDWPAENVTWATG